MKDNWRKLQNGTDIRGVALEGIEGENITLTGENAFVLGKAFASWLKQKKSNGGETLKVSVGMDSRLSGPNLKQNVINGLIESGCIVLDCGLASTPAMFMSTVIEKYKCDGAIMVTASHLPFNRNGLKFFTNEGGLEKNDITQLLENADKGEFETINEKGKVENSDLMDKYSQILVEKIREGVHSEIDDEKPLKNYKIIVDAGNGSGGFFVEKVLKPLGADTTGSQFLNPDGNFPNHIPNPENREAMESIQKAVLDSKADLGIIFDTDVDRAAVVDGKGNLINRNSLIALISQIIIEEHPKTTIVTDSVTSDGLKRFIEDNCGGNHHRFKRGYKNVINEAIRLNNEGIDSQLAIETSGHAALKENYFLDDGAYLVTKILIKMAKLDAEETILDLIQELPQPVEGMEFRLNMQTEDFKEYGSLVIEELEKNVLKKEGWSLAPNNYEGIRVQCNKENGNGWFLLRLSLHDPLLPLNIESDEEGGVKKIASELREFFKKFDKVELEKINEYLEVK